MGRDYPLSIGGPSLSAILTGVWTTDVRPPPRTSCLAKNDALITRRSPDLKELIRVLGTAKKRRSNIDTITYDDDRMTDEIRKMIDMKEKYVPTYFNFLYGCLLSLQLRARNNREIIKICYYFRIKYN